MLRICGATSRNAIAGAIGAFVCMVAGCTRQPCTDPDASGLVARLDLAVASCNAPPIAVVGGPTRVDKASRVVLNAGSTTDPNGDSLQYRWALTRVPEDSAAVLSDVDAVTTTFTADKSGTYRITLVASDSELESVEKAFNILSQNTPPTAVAGMDVRIGVGEAVRLDASGSSDDNGDPLSFRWDVVGAPNGSLAVVDADARFAPDVRGRYEIRLTAGDGEAESTDTMLVSMGVSDNRPVALAGSDLRVPRNTMVMLDGSRSRDADGDTLTYSWTSVRSPAGSVFELNAASTARPTFVPMEYGIYVFELIVSDGYYLSEPSRVEVQVVPMLSNQGMFDPSRVYVLGTIQEGVANRYTLCDLSAETSISGGFPGTPERLAVRPRDGALLYIDATESMRRIRVFAPDTIEFSLVDSSWTYPQDPAANDPMLSVPNCPMGVRDFLIDPANSEIVYTCTSNPTTWYRDDGSELRTCVGVGSPSVLALHPDGSMLCSASAMTAAGVVTVVDPGQGVGYATSPIRPIPGGGFWVGAVDEVRYARYRITARADVSTDYVHPINGIEFGSAFVPFAGFDGAGDLWLSGRVASSTRDSVFRWGNAAPIAVFTEAATDVCKFDATVMVTGP